LDFKAGLDFYLGPFFLPQRLKDTNFHELVSRKARKEQSLEGVFFISPFGGLRGLTNSRIVFATKALRHKVPRSCYLKIKLQLHGFESHFLIFTFLLFI